MGNRSVRPCTPLGRGRSRRLGRGTLQLSGRAGDRRRRGCAQLLRTSWRSETPRGGAGKSCHRTPDARAHATARRDRARLGARCATQSRPAKATEATIPPLTAAEKQSAYRLAVLMAQRPGELDEELRPAAVAAYAKALPVGDTTELLRRRPA